MIVLKILSKIHVHFSGTNSEIGFFRMRPPESTFSGYPKWIHIQYIPSSGCPKWIHIQYIPSSRDVQNGSISNIYLPQDVQNGSISNMLIIMTPQTD